MKDLFSTQSKAYSKFRPEYPQALYDYILEHTPGRVRAWDCATGNGQAAKVLSGHFEEVCATDISQQQLAQAHPADNIVYSLQPAEQTHFPEAHFDLITVAQALHWFDAPAFFAEARRVAKPGALLAVWGYAELSVDNTAIHDLLHDFYQHTVGPYWDPARRHVERHYADIHFPFEVRHPASHFRMTFKWQREEMEGYLNSWSAVQTFIRQEGYNPVDQLLLELSSYWGEYERQTVHFPIFLHTGIFSSGS